jgi:hypothetical protein
MVIGSPVQIQGEDFAGRLCCSAPWMLPKNIFLVPPDLSLSDAMQQSPASTGVDGLRVDRLRKQMSFLWSALTLLDSGTGPLFIQILELELILWISL